MKKVMTLLALCILSSASAMNKKDDYLYSQHHQWELISKPSKSKSLKSSYRYWETELTYNPSKGYAPTNASVFNDALYKNLKKILLKQIAALFRGGASWPELAPLVLQEAVDIDIPLSQAQYYSNSVAFYALLRERPAFSVFTWAIAEHNPEALRIAVERGIDINSAISYTQETALMHWSVSSYGAPHIPTLLALGANSNAQNKQGRTPLMYALHHWQEKTTEFLLAHGANPYMHDNKGQHVLSYAGTEKKLQALILKGLENYKCLTCPACEIKPLGCTVCKNKILKLLPCSNKHLGKFICAECRITIQANSNTCPLCSNQLS